MLGLKFKMFVKGAHGDYMSQINHTTHCIYNDTAMATTERWCVFCPPVLPISPIFKIQQIL